MRILTIILLFFSLAGFSQSVHIDGPTGQVSDLDAVTSLVATDILILERSDSSKQVTFENFIAMPHGSYVFHDSSVTLDMSTGVWTMVTNAWHNLFIQVHGDDIAFAGDSVTITYPGAYMIIMSVSFSGTAGDAYEFTIFKNNVITDYVLERTTSQNDVGNLSLPMELVDLVAGDDLKFMIRNTASNDDATIIACSGIIWRFHL